PARLFCTQSAAAMRSKRNAGAAGPAMAARSRAAAASIACPTYKVRHQRPPPASTMLTPPSPPKRSKNASASRFAVCSSVSRLATKGACDSAGLDEAIGGTSQFRLMHAVHSNSRADKRYGLVWPCSTLMHRLMHRFPTGLAVVCHALVNGAHAVLG